jgi:hypothetical protein
MQFEEQDVRWSVQRCVMVMVASDGIEPPLAARAQNGHRKGTKLAVYPALQVFPGSYMAARSLYLLVTTGLTLQESPVLS